jgi:hypothetical protein
VIVPEYSLDQGEEMNTEEDQSVVTSDMEHVFSDMEHVSFDMELVPCEPRMSHSGSSQLHGNPSSDLEPMQPEGSQDMGYLPDYEPLLPSPAQLTDAIDYPEESSDDDLILVKVTKEVVPVTKKLVRTMSERDSDSEDTNDLDLLRSLPSKKYLIDSSTKQLEGPTERRMNGYVAKYAYSLVDGDPLTFKQAMALPDADEWLKATDDEIQSLNEIETWDLVDMPSGRKPIGTKWVFKRKYKSDGSLDKYKTYLVCTNYSQK